MRERHFRYIPHSQRAAYEAIGWVVSDLGEPHSHYSVLGEWARPGEPVTPSHDAWITQANLDWARAELRQREQDEILLTIGKVEKYNARRAESRIASGLNRHQIRIVLRMVSEEMERAS